MISRRVGPEADGLHKEKAWAVLTWSLGSIKTIQCPERSIGAGSNFSPRPPPKLGVFRIKKGQSLPNCAAYDRNWLVSSSRLNCLFSSSRVNAPSEEPPPRPAPMGICLYR